MFIDNICINWSEIDKCSYLNNIKALNNIKELRFDYPITFFAGENGSGKSTLLEALAIATGFNPEGGTKNYNFETYNSHSNLHEAIGLSRTQKEKWGYFFRAENFYNIATKENEYLNDYSLELHSSSHGESFMKLMKENFMKQGLYILDEPESALSPQMQLSLIYEIYKSVNIGSQFIIATHSPILLGMGKAQIYNFDDTRVNLCDYEDTDSYIITSMFINDRKRLLNYLLEE